MANRWLSVLIITNILSLGLLGYIAQQPTSSTTQAAEETQNYFYGGELPKNWNISFDESPPILATLDDRKAGNAAWLINQPEKTVCFSGGCDLPAISIHVVNADALKKIILAGKAYPTEVSQITYSWGEKWKKEIIYGKDIDVLTSSDLEGKYPSLRTYFLFGEAPPPPEQLNNGLKFQDIGYVVTVATDSDDIVHHFLHTIDLLGLPKSLPIGQ